MGLKRCSVPGCFNDSAGSVKSFFKVNAKHRNLETWKKFCQSETVSGSSYICQDHFHDEDFVNPNNKRQGLLRYVVPRIRFVSEADFFPEPTITADVHQMLVDEDFDFFIDGSSLEVAGEIEVGSEGAVDRCAVDLDLCCKLSKPKKVHPNLENDHDYLHNPKRCIMIAEKMVELEAQSILLKKELRKKTQNLYKKQSVIEKLRKELHFLKQRIEKTPQQLTDPVLLELQANKLRKCRGARYSDEMKNLALVLHYCSTKAYKQMRQIFALPSITTIRRWLSRIEVREGFSESIFNLLQIKSNILPEDEKVVTLFFDEMSLTEKVSYYGNAKPDYFSGFPTRLPGKSQTDTSTRAKSAMVLMIKSIKSGFKQAIGYFFCRDLKSEDLKEIIDQAISLVFKTGLVPKVLVCDQNSINRALFSKEYHVSEQKPFFEITRELTKHRIYCMFDAPHLYKSTRNNLLKHNAVYDGGVCSFQHIVDLYWEDVKHKPRTVPGLTDEHIKLAQFAEMNVGLAAQTLSRSVAVGLRAYVRTGKLPNAANSTATYCEDFDQLFDTSNSSNFNTPKAAKRPLQANSIHWIILEAMSQRLKSLRFIDRQCYSLETEQNFKKLVKQSRIPYFIDGWLLYIAALGLLWEDLHSSYGFKFLRTRNLSQDCLEHFFSVIRWKNGNNNHPDPSLFSSAYKALVINHLVVPDRIGNVQADLSKYIVNRSELSKIQIVRKKPSRPQYLMNQSEEPMMQIETSDVNQLANVHWTTGWACSKLTHQECLKRVTADADDIDEDVSFLADLKKYTPSSRIVTPGEQVFRYFQGVCKIFDKHFEPLLKLDTCGVKEELMDIVQLHFGFSGIQQNEAIEEIDDDPLILDDEKLIMNVLCEPCALKITNKYLNMLIACKLGEINSSFRNESAVKKKSRKTEKAKKLSIVQLSKLMTSNELEYETEKKQRASRILIKKTNPKRASQKVVK